MSSGDAVEDALSNDLDLQSSSPASSSSPKPSVGDRIRRDQQKKQKQLQSRGETGIFDTLSFLFSGSSTGGDNNNKKEGGEENASKSDLDQSKSLKSDTAYSNSTAYQQAKTKKKSPRSTTMDREFKESLLSAENGQGDFYDDLSSGLNPLISTRDNKSPSNHTSDFPNEDAGIELTVLDGENNEKNELSAREPPDVKNFGYNLFILQGIGMLFPWNCFINAGQYFKKKLQKTSYTDYIENYFELTFQFSHLVMLFISVYYQHLIPLRYRTIHPLVVQAVVFLILLILVFVPGSNGMFWFIIVLSLIAGGATSIFQSGMFGLAGMLPSRYTQAIMVGQASGAIKVSLMFIIFLKSLNNAMMTGLAFFIMAVAMICVCLWGCIVLFDLPIVKYYIRASERDDEYRARGEKVRPDFRGIIKSIWVVAVAVILTYGLTLSIFPGLADAVRGSDYWYANNNDCKACEFHFKCLKGTEPFSKGNSAAINLYSTLETSPVPVVEDTQVLHGWNSSQREQPVRISVDEDDDKLVRRMLLQSESGQTCETAKEACESCNSKSLWLPVYCFLTFNVGDFVGRSIVGKYQFVGPNNLLWPVLGRLLFIPVFMLCNITPTYLTVVFKSDFWPFFFMFLMAVSNGSLGSLCMMYGPGLVNQKDKETAGTLMITALTIGLNSGSFLSFLLKWIATREVPL